MSTDPSPHRERKRRRRANHEGGRHFDHRVKVSAEEESRLLVLAHRQGVTVARLLVESALALGEAGEGVDRQAAITELFEVRRSLAGVANNINQIAHHVNDVGAVPDPVRDELTQALEAVRWCAGEINAALELMRR
jgi:hypothetical protein